MVWSAVYDAIAKQDWLEPVGESLQKAIFGAYTSAGPAGLHVKNVLHGTWFGHPLHPALVSVPLGAWTAAQALDLIGALTGKDDLAPGADAAIGVGLLAALAAAAAGATDWEHTDGKARRIGLVHGALNLAIAGAYGTSFLLRRSGNRPAGRLFSSLGYATSLLSAHLGGELIYGQGVGVNHAAVAAPADFVPVLADAELAENQSKRVHANGVPVLLVRQDGQIRALAETCSHLGGPLSEGKIEGDVVTCPWHGSQFRLSDGSIVNGPATFPQPCFETRVREGQIEIRGGRQATVQQKP